MSQSINIKTLKTFDPVDYLETEADMAVYLDAVMQDGDAGLLAAALGDVAKARGMSEIAKAAGLTREALYKALRADAQPRLETVQRVFAALGLKLSVQPT